MLENPDILFFSRGRGRGHAENDLVIASELKRINSDVKILFASYDIGATVFRDAGKPILDLFLPELNPFPETVVRAARIILAHRPLLVLAHEEPAVLSAAKIANIVTGFLTHWLPDRSDPYVQAMEHADRIIFLENEGLFSELREVHGRVKYCGPLVRPMTYALDDRSEIRSHLRLNDEKLIVVLPGSPDEQSTPIFHLVIAAFNLISSPKRLLWVGGRDYSMLTALASQIPHVQIVENFRPLEMLMIASDAVITKGTYNISRELCSLGIASISLSHGMNYIDDMYVRTFNGSLALWANETTHWRLACAINDILTGSLKVRPSGDLEVNGGRKAAGEILALLTLARGLPSNSNASSVS